MLKSRIKREYIFRISLLLIIAIGGMILFYNIFAEDYYIKKSKQQIVYIYEQINNMELADLKRTDKNQLDEYVEQGFTISILKDDKMVYTSLNTRRTKKQIKRLTKEIYDQYSEEAYADIKDNNNAIVLRGKKIENNQAYLIHLEIKIKTLSSSVKVFSDFLLQEMIVFLLIGILLAIYMGNRISKPIEYLSRMTKYMAKNDYNEIEEYKFRNDEIGDLKDHIVEMYEEISGHVNELNNYNYLLKHQNEDLVEFDRRRKEFISKATHELKTPLAIISSQMEMVNLEYPEVVKEYYTSIVEEIEKMSKLIRNMLNDSFYEETTNEIKLEEGNLSELIKNMKQKYNAWMETKQIKCQVEIDDDIFIKMRSEQIEQAINNYVINAYEHTDKNGMVKISLKKLQGKAVITVYNEGKNIEEEKMETIWNSYNQTEKVTNSNVGLGLFIVKDIVRIHRGKCFAKNESNGVKFVMEFPLA